MRGLTAAVDPPTRCRRGRALAGVVVVVLLTVAGCGGGGSAGGEATADRADGAAFPVEVRHGSGTTTVQQEPVRIVDTTGSGLGLLLSLGVAPVQTNLSKNAALQPFQQAALDRLGARPELTRAPETTLQVETVAAAQPDLIISETYYSDTVRAQLEAIAPVVDLLAPEDGGWRANLGMLGAALGMSAQADRLVAETDRRLAESVDSVQVEGKTVAYIFNDESGGAFSVCNTPLYPPVELLTAIGLSTTPEVQALDGGTCTEISLELLSATLGSTDFLVISELYDGAAGERFLQIPVVAALPAVQQGRYHIVEGPGGPNSAMDQFSPYALDVVLPELAAIGGAVSRIG